MKSAKASPGFKRIAIGADHAGFALKETLKAWLLKEGLDVLDVGTLSRDPVDYPDVAEYAARLVSGGERDGAVLICGSGAGMCIVANKFPRVRAVGAATAEAARLGRAHNDANVLCLGARMTDAVVAEAAVHAWLHQPFEGGRHERRVEKISVLDRGIVPFPPYEREE